MKLIILLINLVVASKTYGDWAVDLSRRTKEVGKRDVVEKETSTESKGFFDFILNSGDPIQEVVVLNTERGFVPATINTKEGMQYRIHVVNVNEKDKNVSFVLDAFSEHHATYFGKIKTFIITPQKEGIYTFQSPETSSQGRLVVYPAKKSNADLGLRSPASE
jgi:hypothetical protein